MTAPAPTGQPDDRVGAVADAIRPYLLGIGRPRDDEVVAVAGVAAAAYEREVLGRRPDAGRLHLDEWPGDYIARVAQDAHDQGAGEAAGVLQSMYIEHCALLAALAAETAAREEAEARLAGLKHRFGMEFHEIEQTLGKALGYPAYGPEMFEGGQPNGDVCVGEHVPASLAAEAARRIAAETAAREQADRRAAAAQGRVSRHLERADAEEESWRLIKGERDQLAEEVATLRQHILDIDAHATPYGDLPGDPGWVGTYLVSAGALHRALGKIGHTAPKCSAEAERDAADRLLADALHLRQHGERPPGAPADPAAETWTDWDRWAEEHLRGPATKEER